MKRIYIKPEIRKYPTKLQKVVAGSPAPESDRRLKRDIHPLARLDDGTQLYRFKYLWSETVHVGVMAQDLLADPQRAEAVLMLPNGHYAVDYRRLGLQMATLDDWNAIGIRAVTLATPLAETSATRAA